MRRMRSTALVALAALLMAGTASAQTPPAGARPWAEGVTPEDQRTALQLFNEGNQFLRDSIFPKAAEKYREALKHWNHPAIHYNLALALVNLDQPIEMYRELEEAMKYGPAPIDEDKFDRAKGLKILVERQLANVEYTIDIPGAILSFDGRDVFTGPGTWKQLITAGEHTVIARAEGYVTNQFQTKIAGGEVAKRTIELLTESEALVETRLMPGWVPITVSLVGVGILGGGFALHQSAKNQLADYDAGIRACAAVDPTGGCTTPPAGLFDQKTSAETKQTIAIGTYALGGVALATGVTLFILNRPRLVPRDPKAGQVDEGVSLTPVISPSLTGLAASGRF